MILSGGTNDLTANVLLKNTLLVQIATKALQRIICQRIESFAVLFCHG